VILQRFIESQLVKKYAVFYGNRQFTATFLTARYSSLKPYETLLTRWSIAVMVCYSLIQPPNWNTTPW